MDSDDSEVDWRRGAAEMGIEVTDEFSTMLRVYKELIKDPEQAAWLDEQFATMTPKWEPVESSDPHSGQDDAALLPPDLERHLEHVVAAWSASGTVFEDPLSDEELRDVERALGAPLPPELRTFLGIAFPVGDDWPRWREGPATVVHEAQTMILEMFDFDIEANSYWFPAWGPRPADVATAQAVARAEVAEWPPLVPVYAHRFMPSAPAAHGNPVWSFAQPVDTVYYGVDFCDYLQYEFGAAAPPVRRRRPRYIDFWTDALDLDGVWALDRRLPPAGEDVL